MEVFTVKEAVELNGADNGLVVDVTDLPEHESLYRNKSKT